MPFFSVVLYLVVSRITHRVGLWLIQTGRIDEATIFLYLIDHAARMLRPVNIVGRVGTSGIAVIHSMYPDPTRPPSSVESTVERASRQRTDAAARSAPVGNVLQQLGKLGMEAVKGVYSKPTAPAHTDAPARGNRRKQP